MGEFLEKCAKVFGTLILFLAAAALGAMTTALPVMLTLGVLHNDASPAVPALGFWATFLALWGISAAIGYVRASKR